MSSKQSTSKQDPRIAKKEVVVTRHKSAQMKRQLRVKDRSMKHLTDLLKSPVRETPASQQSHTPKNVQKPKTPPKIKESITKSVEKVQKLPEKAFKLSKVLRKKVALVEDVEFYPDKRKRKLDVKKVVLKPNHDMQMVAGIVGSVKRKCGVPHKATVKSKPASLEPAPLHSQLSMAEVISIMEEDLTDEDLMEILTCPSPVWWEDGPGEEYIEEAVFRRTPEPPTKTKKQDVSKMAVNTADKEKKAEDIKIPNLNKKSEKFLKKRSKLEGLLGNIKNKNNTKVNVDVNSNSEERVASSSNDVFSEDLVVICSNYRKGNSGENIKDGKRKRMRSDSDSDEVTFHDSSMNEDELLRSLENVTIPIDTSKGDVIVIDDDDDDDVEIIPLEIKKENAKKVSEETITDTVEVKTDSNEANVSKNMPGLIKIEATSPKSSKNGTTSQDVDTNVKCTLDEDMNASKIVMGEQPVVIKKENELLDIKQESCKEIHENITINDIKSLNTKESNQDDREKSSKMNDYYKKCKKVCQKKEKTDINKNDLSLNKVNEENGSVRFIFCESCLPKTKKVSDDKNVKYCLKCSSIFDSDDCIYCLEKSRSNEFTCFPCRTRFCCPVLYKAHNKYTHMGETVYTTDPSVS